MTEETGRCARAGSARARSLGVLKEVEGGQKVKDICRRHGISEGTYHRWTSKYGGMKVSDAKRLKELEVENRRLKKLVADMALDNQMLKEVLDRKW